MQLELASPADLLAQIRGILRPPPRMSVSDWADAFRKLSREDSASPGGWSTVDRPYQRGIMDAASDPRYERVSVQGNSQWGKTQILLNLIGRFAHLDPGPMMVVQHSIHTAEKFSKTRLAPMLRDTKVLGDLFADAVSRESSNTILEKTFPGGLLVIVGSNAPAGLASQPIRYLLLDEVDRFEESAGSEGDPKDLAEARTIDFEGRRLIYACSSPGLKGYSRIEKEMDLSDKRRWLVPCPECKEARDLRWSNVMIPPDNPDGAFYACPECAAPIDEGRLRRAVQQGQWEATKPEIKRHAGFYVNGIMTRRLSSLAVDHVKARAKGIRSLQVFMNTGVGELWDPRDGEDLQTKGLMGRRENYGAGVPYGVGLITAGVDIQDDRIEIFVKGWGASEESWLLGVKIIPGNLATAVPWDELQRFLLQPFVHACGERMGIRLACIDMGGHYSRQVKAFCRRAAMKGRVLAVKGSSTRMVKTVERSKKARHWMADTIAIKDTVFARLRIETPGPSYMHFPSADWCDQSYFDQLTAEKVVRRRAGGMDSRAYEKITPDARNEALDGEVYATAALWIYNPVDLQMMASRYSPPKGEVPTPDDAPTSAPKLPAKAKVTKKPAPSNWVTRYKR